MKTNTWKQTQTKIKSKIYKEVKTNKQKPTQMKN